MARSATVCHCGRGELWIDGPKCNRQIQFWILPSTLQPFSVAQKKRIDQQKQDLWIQVSKFLWYATFEPQGTNQHFLHPFLPLNVRLLCRTVPFVEPSLKTLNLGDANCISLSPLLEVPQALRYCNVFWELMPSSTGSDEFISPLVSLFCIILICLQV